MAERQEIWSCPQCGTQLDVGALGFCADVVCPQCGTRACLHTLLANFKLDGVLGIGGMSEVFKAHDMVLGRPLAIKVLNSAYRGDAERIGRFEAESSLMAKVRHENVVSVYSAGWARGQFYIAMELVEGRNLETLVSEQKCLLPPAALEMTRQTALGLQAAHESGVLHRDVKPGNVLVTPEGVAKVLDFGLSQGAEEEQDKEGVIWATPFYVPPETLMRAPEDVRADIYALGMMLRNLLTGEDALKEEVTGISSLLAAKRKLPRMRDAYPKLHESLCDLVDHMTAFDVSDRPADYAEVLEEIAEVQARVGVSSLRETDRARRRRNKLMTSGLLGAAAAGLVAAVPVAFMTPPVQEQEVLPVPAVAWSDLDGWQDACHEADAGHWAEAADLFTELATHSEHPGVAATAAMHAAMLCVLTDGPAEVDAAARELAAQKRRADEISSTAMVKPDAAEAPATLRTAALVLQAQDAVDIGQQERAEKLLAAAAEAAGAGTKHRLQGLIDDFRRDVPRMASRATRAQVRRALSRGEFETARAGMQRLHTAKLTELEKAELGVQEEVCEAGEALFDLLKRKKGDAFNPAASEEDILILISSLGQGNTFNEEARILLMMLRGEYARAFKYSPKDPARPFSIVVADWKARLRK